MGSQLLDNKLYSIKICYEKNTIRFNNNEFHTYFLQSKTIFRGNFEG